MWTGCLRRQFEGSRTIRLLGYVAIIGGLLATNLAAQESLNRKDNSFDRDLLEQILERSQSTNVTFAESFDKQLAMLVKPDVFSSRLNSSVVGAKRTGMTSSENVQKFGSVPDVTKLATYNANVQKSLKDASERPSALRAWHGVKLEKPDVFPDAVLLLGSSGGICSGTLVSSTKVITAAHCVCRENSRFTVVGLSAGHVDHMSPIDTATIKTFIPCSDISSDDLAAKNINKGDVALVTLVSPVPSAFPPRKIATVAMLAAAAAVRAVGFGNTDKGIVGVKYAVDVPIASYDCVEAEFRTPSGYSCAAGAEMVARGGGRDTCGGDSGGPIMLLGPNLQVYVAGVTSRSLNPEGDCGSGGIYVRIVDATIRTWLATNGVPSEAFAN